MKSQRIKIEAGEKVKIFVRKNQKVIERHYSSESYEDTPDGGRLPQHKASSGMRASLTLVGPAISLVTTRRERIKK